jgi:hypothetical protein
LNLRRRRRIELSDTENAEHFGGMFVAAGDTRFAALVAKIDLDGADRLQSLPGKRRGQMAVCRLQAFLQGAIQ